MARCQSGCPWKSELTRGGLALTPAERHWGPCLLLLRVAMHCPVPLVRKWVCTHWSGAPPPPSCVLLPAPVLLRPLLLVSAEAPSFPGWGPVPPKCSFSSESSNLMVFPHHLYYQLSGSILERKAGITTGSKANLNPKPFGAEFKGLFTPPCLRFSSLVKP